MKLSRISVLIGASFVHAKTCGPENSKGFKRVALGKDVSNRSFRCRVPSRTLPQKFPRGGDFVTVVPSFVESLSDTKAKCWGWLLASIAVENFASALSKAARVKKSLPLLYLAFALFLMGHLGFFLAIEKIDLGLAYAVWSALGTLALTTVGIIFFEESYDNVKLGCLLMIILGVVGLNLREGH